MGLRNRLRKLAIIAGHGELRRTNDFPINNTPIGVSANDVDIGKLVADAADIAGKVKDVPSSKMQGIVERLAKPMIEKSLRPKFEKMNLVQQVKTARKILRMMGVVDFRKSFLPGFGDDIKDMVKQGKSDEEILQYYLGCPEFVSFWGDLGMDESHLKVLMEEAKEG